MADSPESLDAWFKREILAHEDAFVRYLARLWPNRDEVTDLRQETYIRVYEAALKSRPTSPKSFLFTTARHLMADRVRRRRVVSIDSVGDFESLNVLVEEVSPEQRTSAYEELRRLAEAIDRLPPRCREVVWLRRVDDLSQKEVAARLGIAQKTVERHVVTGMKLLDAALHAGETPGRESVSRQPDEAEKKHGKP